MSTPLEVCESRDPKKLYKKARAGEITGFTGIDSAYEPPEKPELVIDTGKETPAASVRRVLEYLRDISIIPDEVGAISSVALRIEANSGDQNLQSARNSRAVCQRQRKTEPYRADSRNASH